MTNQYLSDNSKNNIINNCNVNSPVETLLQVPVTKTDQIVSKQSDYSSTSPTIASSVSTNLSSANTLTYDNNASYPELSRPSPKSEFIGVAEQMAITSLRRMYTTTTVK